MADLAAALGVLGLAAVAFVLSVAVGILIGRRLDRIVENRAAESQTASGGQADPGAGSERAPHKEVDANGG